MERSEIIKFLDDKAMKIYRILGGIYFLLYIKTYWVIQWAV
jgi:hypothetical protein